MDGSSCGSDRARSRPAVNIKGTKKAVYPKARRSPLGLARRLGSPFFLPAAILTVAKRAKADAARSEAEAARSPW
jgi:hypothetical protein